MLMNDRSIVSTTAGRAGILRSSSSVIPPFRADKLASPREGSFGRILIGSKGFPGVMRTLC